MLVRKLVSFALLAVLAIAAPVASNLFPNQQGPILVADGTGPEGNSPAATILMADGGRRGGGWLVPPPPDPNLVS